MEVLLTKSPLPKSTTVPGDVSPVARSDTVDAKVFVGIKNIDPTLNAAIAAACTNLIFISFTSISSVTVHQFPHGCLLFIISLTKSS
jgi:hypothetical protein